MRILAIVLAVLGVYMLVDHTMSPINHEVIGLGIQHTGHTVIGVVLLLAAALVFWMSRRRRTAIA